MTMLNNQRVISISEGFDESICWQQCSINKIIVPMDRPLNDTQQIYDQEWCEDNVIFVCQNGYTQHANTRIW